VAQKKNSMGAAIIFMLATLTVTCTGYAAEYHVAINGKDSNPGTRAAPFRTIQHGADAAQPGDVITVHEGVYRERINPPRGGMSDSRRIVYQAAPGEKVEIKGSEVVTNWIRVDGDMWKVTIPNSFFGKFNPYSDVLHGEWFKDNGRTNHTGAVYLNGEWLLEAVNLNEVMQSASDTPQWFGQVDESNTTIWAQFKNMDPNKQTAEINVRQCVFYPSRPGLNYITVRGFTMRHAATPWAGAQSEQIGLVGTHWSKGWIIENNIISHSICTGITLGLKDLGETREASAKGYVQTVRDAIEKGGWSRETVGSHIVRNNDISHCEKNGIHGSLGGAFSVITGNTVHDIHVRRDFGGLDQAGIKFLGGIDVIISGNHIHHTIRGIWLDWMAQGARVSGNLFHDNAHQDLFLEVNHGPFVVDNNIFLSPLSIQSWSHGGAYVHNLVAGAVLPKLAGRSTPYHKAHSTEIAGLHNIPLGDDRYYNNVFIAADLSPYETATLPVLMEGNVFLNSAKPSRQEADPTLKPDLDPALKLVEKPDGYYLEMNLENGWAGSTVRKLVTTELLGKAAIPDLPYEQPDGTPLRIDTDYFGKQRNTTNPAPGPFENPVRGALRLK
jgi:alpha-N-arabinofuranosidase